jgi:hypothetical protein
MAALRGVRSRAVTLVVVLQIATLLVGCGRTTPVGGGLPTSSGSTSTPPPTQISTPSAVPSPTPPPLSGVFGVAIGDFISPPSPTYFVLLFDSTGKVVTQATAHTRSISDLITTLPETSTTSQRVYFLDGDWTVRFLSPDGATGIATQIPPSPPDSAGGSVQAAFSVSPDDQRIAVATVQASGIKLYVEDLSGAHRIDLYSGPIIEWPVAWLNGNLVLQLGFLTARGYGSMNGYHVVSAATANRSSAVCDSGVVDGAPSPAGVLCEYGTVRPFAEVSWDGAIRTLPQACKGRGPRPVALSLDGGTYAAPDCTNSQLRVSIYDLDGTEHPVDVVNTAADVPMLLQPVAWLDAVHLIINDGGTIRVVDLNSKLLSARIGTHTMFGGTVPAQLH